MGYMKHHAIIVSSWNQSKIDEVHAKAVYIFKDQVTSIATSPINMHYSFLIGPDNAAEEYDYSEYADMQRFEFITWLENYCNVDGSSAIRFIELSYYDEKANPKIINHNNSHEN